MLRPAAPAGRVRGPKGPNLNRQYYIELVEFLNRKVPISTASVVRRWVRMRHHTDPAGRHWIALTSSLMVWQHCMIATGGGIVMHACYMYNIYIHITCHDLRLKHGKQLINTSIAHGFAIVAVVTIVACGHTPLASLLQLAGQCCIVLKAPQLRN